jgi:hypothetical protein
MFFNTELLLLRDGASEIPTSAPYLSFQGLQDAASHYLPLDSDAQEIRYLLLSPGTPDDLIVCHLGHTTLLCSRPIQDQALSYC